MDYRDYSVEDFVLDSFFRSWVKHKTPSACEFWKQWMTANPDKAAIVEEAKELVRCLDFTSEDPSAAEIREFKDALIKKFAALPQTNGKQAKGKPANVKPVASRARRSFTLTYPIAAALAFLLLTSLAVIYLLPSRKLNISTTFGETRSITLPDGSRVTLNANSELSYARDWEGEKGRKVWLEGEAFFEIAKKPESTHPEFYVHAGELTVKVLGTAFNVYKRAGKTSVVLQEGSVELSSAGGADLPQQLLMKPGDKVDVEGNSYRMEKVSVEPYLSWKDRRMIFEDTELSAIARLLEDNHGYTVVFKDEQLKQLRFTGSYSTEQLNVLLKALNEAFNINITVADKTIMIQ